MAVSLPWIGFYSFCLTAVVLWLPGIRRFWPIFAGVTLVELMAANLVFPVGAAFLVLTALALHGATALANGRYRMASYAIGIMLLVGLFAHLLPGFQGYQLIAPTRLSADAMSYTRWFGPDKAAAGFLFLAVIGTTCLSGAEWKRLLARTLPVAAVTISVVFALALASHRVDFAPKWTPLMLTFALSNLFLTCIPEEILFRRIIQGGLAAGMHGIRYGWAFAIVLGGALFGLAHLGGGATYAILAAIAGVGYGYAFHATGRIEAAILTHFTLNLTHFIFFTYPGLA